MIKINLVELFQYLVSNGGQALESVDGSFTFSNMQFKKQLELFKLNHPTKAETLMVPEFYAGFSDEPQQLVTQLVSGDIKVYYKDGAWYSPTELNLPDFHFFKTHHVFTHGDKLRLNGQLDLLAEEGSLKSVDNVFHVYKIEEGCINVYKDEEGFYTTRHQMESVQPQMVLRLMGKNVEGMMEDNERILQDTIKLMEEAGTLINIGLFKYIDDIIGKLVKTNLVKTFYLYQVGHRFTTQPRLFVNVPIMPDYSISHNRAFSIIEILNHKTNVSLRLLRDGDLTVPVFGDATSHSHFNTVPQVDKNVIA